MNRAEVRQGVVLALLNELGWPVFDTGFVRPSHGINEDTVDFGLMGTQGNLLAVIIVDAPSKLDADAVDPSLYLSDQSEPIVVHTDGTAWRFMLSHHPLGIACDTALTVKIGSGLAVERFDQILRREKLESGRAQAELARLLAKKPTEAAVMLGTWLSLLSPGDSALLVFLADRAELRTGMRPSEEEVADFFRLREKSKTSDEIADGESEVSLPTIPEPPFELDSSQGTGAVDDVITNPPAPPAIGLPGCWYQIGGKRVSVSNGKAVVLGILRQLEQQTPGFLARCAEHPENMGASRRYIGKTPTNLFPERPDLAADSGKYAEIVPGWLLMTNFSTDVKIRIIALAGAVSGLAIGREISYSLERQS